MHPLSPSNPRFLREADAHLNRTERFFLEALPEYKCLH
jgi:hypothetical protein